MLIWNDRLDREQGFRQARRIFAVFVVILVIYGAFWLAFFSTQTHRYRLTIEIDTPDGVRTGSSVLEVTRRDERWVPLPGRLYTFQRRGEAVFIDLGAGHNIIAVLATGAAAQNTDQFISLPIVAYGYDRGDEDAWARRLPMQGPVELKAPLIPTLVSFSDISNPNTARVVYATEIVETKDARNVWRRSPQVTVDRVAEVLGSGFGFRRAVLETVDDPVTTGLTDRLPWWNAPGRPAHQAHRAMRMGSPFGTSPAEYLFVSTVRTP